MTEALTWDIVRWTISVSLGIFLSILIYKVLKLFLEEMTGSDPNAAVRASDPNRATKRLQRNPGIWLETNWGGLGGGLSGWRVSNGVVYLLLITFLLGCLMLVATTLPPKAEKSTTDTNKRGGPAQNAGSDKGREQNSSEDKDPNKGNQKSDAAADDNQKKDADSKKDDPCVKKQDKTLKPNRKPTPAASGCSVTPSPTPASTPTPSARTVSQTPGQ